MDKEFIATLRGLQQRAHQANQPLLTYLLGMAELEATGADRKTRKLN